MKKVLWVDDDVNTGALRAFVDEFSDNNIEIIKINNPDGFLEILSNLDFDCLIMDMMMPIGEKLTLNDTKGGIHTGFKLLEEYLKQDSPKPIVIFTILSDEYVKKWATDNNIPYKQKQNEVPESFVNFIKSLD